MKELRIQIARQTLEILEKGYYLNTQNQRIDIKDVQELAVRNSNLYRPADYDILEIKSQDILNLNRFETIVEITNESTIEASIRLASNNNVACLNFASAKNPGGGFLNGSQAQEESLARATGLYPCIEPMKEMYSYNRTLKTCLYSNYMIFSQEVPVIRDAKDNLLDSFCKVSIITSPAVNAGVVKQREPGNILSIESVMRNRITMMFNVALVNGIEILILGAWGCGVFQNDPAIIAELFAEQLKGKYKNAFKKVVFAILDRPGNSTMVQFNKAFNIHSK